MRGAQARKILLHDYLKCFLPTDVGLSVNTDLFGFTRLSASRVGRTTTVSRRGSSAGCALRILARHTLPRLPRDGVWTGPFSFMLPHYPTPSLVRRRLHQTRRPIRAKRHLMS